MIRLLDLILEIKSNRLNEYTDEEKINMKIPLDTYSSGGKWFYKSTGEYAGKVVDDIFVPAQQIKPVNKVVQYYMDQPLAPKMSPDTNYLEKNNLNQNLLTDPPFPNEDIPSHSSVMHQPISGRLGSNPGGIYMGVDGKKRYVKLYDNKKQAVGEQIANSIYSGLGIQTTNSFIYSEDGENITYASEIIEDAVELGDVELTQERARKILDGFVGDVLLANWDTVGLSLDNIVYQGKASTDPIRVDNGGALLTRAMGADKPEHLLYDIGEFETLRNPDMNKNYSRIFRVAGYTEQEFNDTVVSQVSKIVKFRDTIGGWENFMQTFNEHQIKTKFPKELSTIQARIAKMLESRTNRLIELADSLR